MTFSTLCASITLPTAVTVSGVAWNGSYIYAVDGLTPWVYVFENNGLFVSRYRTVRVYRTVRYDAVCGRFAAADSSCGGRIYILNARFEEIGSVPLELQSERMSARAIADVGYGVSGGFDVAHPSALRVYAADGSYVMTVTGSPAGREYLHWADFAGRRALNYSENGRTYVTVNRIGGILPENVALKAFIPAEDDLFGAFGVGGLYTYLIPVFTGGVLNTAIFGNFAFIADNISCGC